MEKSIRVEKTAPRDVAILDEGKVRFRIVNRAVQEGDRTIWQLVHRGADLFTGFWELVDAESKEVLVGFYYIPSSYRYGEDLNIRHYPDEGEYLFRRLAHDEDRWVLTTREGEILLETRPPEPSSPTVWDLRVKTAADERVIWPLICLLAFDRLACGRL